MIKYVIYKTVLKKKSQAMKLSKQEVKDLIYEYVNKDGVSLRDEVIKEFTDLEEAKKEFKKIEPDTWYNLGEIFIEYFELYEEDNEIPFGIYCIDEKFSEYHYYQFAIRRIADKEIVEEVTSISAARDEIAWIEADEKYENTTKEKRYEIYDQIHHRIVNPQETYQYEIIP